MEKLVAELKQNLRVGKANLVAFLLRAHDEGSKAACVGG
jgi:hypothetical protein